MTDSTERLQSALAGRYQIEREIGHGGMATVYLARDTRHDRRVALKVLRPELAAVIGAERFAVEIRTTANLQHPHILPLHDSGEVDGTVFYVMPYVEGETVRDRLARDGQLPVDEGIALIKQVASALDYAHRQGVVHRDIKPENILLHDGQALVADFGIALAASKSDNAARLTETGMSLGTPSYMSPEQAMGQRDISARADVYALGCVLYEMLVGEPPFSGPNAQAIVAKILTEPAPSILKQRPRVPVWIDAAVRRALEKLPADRFGSAKEFADALDSKSPASEFIAPSRVRARGFVWALAAAGIVAIVGAFWIGRRSGVESAAAPQWVGEIVGGSVASSEPRLSPDGQSIAFETMVDGQMQIGLQRLGARDWAVLTTDRTRGMAGWISWAHDNSRIYFSRFFEVPLGIWSISPLGHDEKLVLENAGTPEPLPDGSLIVSRIRRTHYQAYRFWPETGRLDSLDAASDIPVGGMLPFIRATPDGSAAVYYGRPSTDSTAPIALYALDLASGKNHLVTNFGGRQQKGFPPSFCITPDGRHVLAASLAGGLSRIIRVPIDGSGREETIMTLPSVSPVGMDVGSDGSIYLAEYTRPVELLRYRPGTGSTDRTPIESGEILALPLMDGRVLTTSVREGHSQVLVRSPGSPPLPFVQTKDETAYPMAQLGADRVALAMTSGKMKSIGIISTATGRIAGRIDGVAPVSIAGSPDGRSIYFVTNGALWSIPSSATHGSDAKRLTSANAVAADPHGAYLVVERVDTSGVQLLRYALPAGPETVIKIDGPYRIAPGTLNSNAVGQDGRIALQVISPASWFWPGAILDQKTGKFELPPWGSGYDMSPGWNSNGEFFTTAASVLATLWRFKPVKR